MLILKFVSLITIVSTAQLMMLFCYFYDNIIIVLVIVVIFKTSLLEVLN